MSFETHSRKHLPHSMILKNFKVFLPKKNHLFFNKNPKFERFENSYSIPVAFYGKIVKI